MREEQYIYQNSLPFFNNAATRKIILSPISGWRHCTDKQDLGKVYVLSTRIKEYNTPFNIVISSSTNFQCLSCKIIRKFRNHFSGLREKEWGDLRINKLSAVVFLDHCITSGKYLQGLSKWYAVKLLRNAVFKNSNILLTFQCWSW